MSSKMRFYRSADGNLQVESGPSFTVMGRFLIEDIQDSPTTCREILMLVESISRGERASGRWVGNAHILLLARGEALVESLFESAEEPFHLSLGEFSEILENWLHFLEK
jgi:hypothetical protein